MDVHFHFYEWSSMCVRLNTERFAVILSFGESGLYIDSNDPLMCSSFMFFVLDEGARSEKKGPQLDMVVVVNGR